MPCNGSRKIKVSYGSKHILTIYLVIQLAFIAAVGLDFVGINIPIFRQLVGFIYLTFLPGFAILRILKFNMSKLIDVFLYSIGLSLFFLMLIGVIINFLYRFIGIEKPFTEIFLILNISAAVSSLFILNYIQNSKGIFYISYDPKFLFSPSTLILLLLPILAVIGTFLVNSNKNNFLLLALIFILACLILLIAFSNFIPTNVFPLAIFVVSISLLFHYSLISRYLCGWDVFTEYYYSKLVITNSYWDYTIPHNVNAMLSTNILLPIYSILLNIDLILVIKVICPLIFALVPVVLYRIFQSQFNHIIAYLSSYFFVSLFVFFTEMLALVRQQFAEFFLVLLVLLMVDDKIDKVNRTILAILFSFSLIVSHYGLSYIYLSFFIFLLIIYLFSKIPTSMISKNMYIQCLFSNDKKNLISSSFIILFVVFSLAYYIYVSNSSQFFNITKLLNHMFSSIFSEFLSHSTGVSVIAKSEDTLLYSLWKILILLSQIFISIGIIESVINFNKYKLNTEFYFFSLINYCMLLCAVFFPYLSEFFNLARTYHISLIFLSPFCITGGISVFNRIFNAIKVPFSLNRSLKMVSIFLFIFLLFNTKFIFAIANDKCTSISLAQNTINDAKISDKLTFYSQYHPEGEILNAEWLSKNRNTNVAIYSDIASAYTVLTGYIMPYGLGLNFLAPHTKISTSSYIYLGYSNVHYGAIYYPTETNSYFNCTDISSILNESNLIYSNNDSCTYYTSLN